MNETQYQVVVSTAILGSSALLWWYYLSRKSLKQETPYDCVIDLVAGEREGLMQFPAISTITFYEGDITAQDQVKHQLCNILKMNSWLSCWLVHAQDPMLKKKLVKAVYVQKFPENRLPLHYVEIPVDPSHPEYHNLKDINEKMPVEQINPLLAKDLVKFGVHCINNSAEPLMKVVVLKFFQSNQSKIVTRTALIFSMSHVLGDGHTYYSIYNMLDGSRPVLSMEVKRKPEFDDKLDEVYGPQLRRFFERELVFGVLWTILFRRAAKVFTLLVDEEKVKQAKDAYKSQRTSFQPPFISTNDLITSWLFSKMQNDFDFMAINYRNRWEGYHDLLAGNYEAVIAYPKEECQTPEDIRLSVQPPYRSRSNRLPNLWESWKCNYGLVTNWSTFYQTVNFQHCRNIAHFPLLDGSSGFMNDGAIVFRVNDKQLGVIVITRSLPNLPELLKTSNSFFKLLH